MFEDRDGISRRSVLLTATGTAALTGAAGTGTAQEGESHTVDMTDDLIFDPDSITIAPGDSIVWENVGAVGHSVTAYEDNIPEGAEFFASGGFEAEEPARNAYTTGEPENGDIPGGETYEHTFETEGTFEYFCIPHESVGMLGSIEVTPGGAEEEVETGPTAPRVPDTARDLVMGAFGALLSILGLTYLFVKYSGEYGASEEER